MNIKSKTNPKGAGRPKGTKKMFHYRVEPQHQEILKEIAIYLNKIK